MSKIKSSQGEPIQVVLNVYPYVWDAHGDWWTCNPQHGWVRVAPVTRALADTLAHRVLELQGKPRG